eukprot:365216-Chlamydomonas_euryale.AAC.13
MQELLRPHCDCHARAMHVYPPPCASAHVAGRADASPEAAALLAAAAAAGAEGESVAVAAGIDETAAWAPPSSRRPHRPPIARSSDKCARRGRNGGARAARAAACAARRCVALSACARASSLPVARRLILTTLVPTSARCAPPCHGVLVSDDNGVGAHSLLLAPQARAVRRRAPRRTKRGLARRRRCGARCLAAVSHHMPCEVRAAL